MDPLVSLVTTVTGGVLRRIADAIDGQAAPPAPAPVHIENLHIHVTEHEAGGPARTWLRSKTTKG